MIYLTQTFSSFLLYVNYKINQDYIASELCEKKEVENNCCKGSCYFAKSVKKEEERKSQSMPSFLKEYFSKKVIDNEVFFQFKTINSNASKGNFIYLIANFCEPVSKIFQPPD